MPAQEDYIGQFRSRLIPTHLQYVGIIKIAGTRGWPPAYRLFTSSSSVTNLTVWASTRYFQWNRRATDTVGYFGRRWARFRLALKISRWHSTQQIPKSCWSCLHAPLTMRGAAHELVVLSVFAAACENLLQRSLHEESRRTEPFNVDVLSFIQQHGLTPHMYADDIQVHAPRWRHLFFRPCCWLCRRHCLLDEFKSSATQCCFGVRHRWAASTPSRLFPSVTSGYLLIRIWHCAAMLTPLWLAALAHWGSFVVSTKASRFRFFRRQWRGWPASAWTMVSLSSLIFQSSSCVDYTRCRMHAAPRLIFDLRRCVQRIDALICLHTGYEFHKLNKALPLRVWQSFYAASAASNRRGLRSIITDRLVVPRLQLSRCWYCYLERFSVAFNFLIRLNTFCLAIHFQVLSFDCTYVFRYCALQCLDINVNWLRHFRWLCIINNTHQLRSVALTFIFRR